MRKMNDCWAKAYRALIFMIKDTLILLWVSCNHNKYNTTHMSMRARVP